VSTKISQTIRRVGVVGTTLGGGTRVSDDFAALLVSQKGAAAQLASLSLADLPPGDVTIEVTWSSMNYKDALAVSGTGPVVRSFPMVCGIDLAGVVVESTDALIAVGDTVAVDGCGLGEEHFGGFARYARVLGAWCAQIPGELGARRAMALGTAGITAMLSFLALERVENGPTQLDGRPLLVTGAQGGVGSLAVLIGSRLGYRVTASTGRTGDPAYLEALGAAEIVDRHELSDGTSRPLDSVRFGAAVDVVGGKTLANVLSMIRPGGAVAASGNVGGPDLATSVYPFILRGVTLAGVNSVHLAREVRADVWRRLADVVPVALLDQITSEVALPEVPALADAMLAGSVRGRVVVALGP
jgi:acrylyl-CoA reductase (NADPH)